MSTTNGTSATANGARTRGPETVTAGDTFAVLPDPLPYNPNANGAYTTLHGKPLVDPFQELADAIPDDQPAPHWGDELRAWWLTTADSDIGGSLDKVVAYGGSGAAYDLVATGHDLAAMNHRKVSDEEAVEIAIAFYLSSKVNRWMAAIIDGRRPSDDTLLDISYYAMMSRRNRAVGGWPIA